MNTQLSMVWFNPHQHQLDRIFHLEEGERKVLTLNGMIMQNRPNKTVWKDMLTVDTSTKLDVSYLEMKSVVK